MTEQEGLWARHCPPPEAMLIPVSKENTLIDKHVYSLNWALQ